MSTWNIGGLIHPLGEHCSVVVIDDDEGFCSLVSAVYERAGYAVEVAATGEEALELVRVERPSLFLVEVHLAGMSGYDVCRILRAKFGDAVPIIFVSGDRTESFDRVAGLRLGADDYLVKPVDPDELLARSDRLVGRMRSATPRSITAPRNLTRREMDVLELLVSGLRPKEIAQELSVSRKTVAVHVQNILMKFGVHSQAQAVAAAISAGFTGVYGRRNAHSSVQAVQPGHDDVALSEAPRSEPARPR
jgi:DNA-binding NarL/FixJ family response regulator